MTCLGLWSTDFIALARWRPRGIDAQWQGLQRQLGGRGRRWRNMLAHPFGKSRGGLRVCVRVFRHRFDEFDDEDYNAVKFIKH